MSKEQWGLRPIAIGRNNIEDVEEFWYHDLMKYNEVRSKAKSLAPSKVWILDDTAIVSNDSLKHAVEEVWEFTDEDFESGFHGHHVAGIISCLIHGFFPNVKIGFGKVLSHGNGRAKTSWITSGIKKGDELGYQVMNGSFGGSIAYTEIYRAISKYLNNEANFFVASSGNDGMDTDYPAAWSKEFPNLISVGAIEKKGENYHIASYSSIGAVTLVFPGTYITSSFPNNKYDHLTGTSQATAFCSGLIAASKAIKPEFNVNDFYYVLKKTSKPLTKLKSHEGSGIVDIVAFLNEVSKLPVIVSAVPKRKKNFFQKIFNI